MVACIEGMYHNYLEPKMSFIGARVDEIIEKTYCPSLLYQFHGFCKAGRKKIFVVHFRSLWVWDPLPISPQCLSGGYTEQC